MNKSDYFCQVSIIIMNLLIGLAISNITAQFQSAGELEKRLGWVKIS